MRITREDGIEAALIAARLLDTLPTARSRMELPGRRML